MSETKLFAIYTDISQNIHEAVIKFSYPVEFRTAKQLIKKQINSLILYGKNTNGVDISYGIVNCKNHTLDAKMKNVGIKNIFDCWFFNDNKISNADIPDLSECSITFFQPGKHIRRSLNGTN